VIAAAGCTSDEMVSVEDQRHNIASNSDSNVERGHDEFTD
jgi:hypothetical protein